MSQDSHARFLERLEAAKVDALTQSGIPTPMHRKLSRLYDVLSDAAEEDDVGLWSLSADDYGDFLESWRAGHRVFKTWINERRAGATVTLTRQGAVIFKAIDARVRLEHGAAQKESTR